MNILFITADQWRGECLSARGHPILRTPNIDQLAREGVMFAQHYAQASPCAPSRASLHTGMYLHNNRVCINGTPLQSRHSNWALEMSRAGYRPHLFGYTDTAMDPTGLDADDRRLKHYTEPLPGLEADTVYQNETPMNWVGFLQDHGYTIPANPYDLYGLQASGKQWEAGGKHPLPSAIHRDHHETGYTVNRCIDWIRKQRGSWVVHLSLFRPHPPFVAPEPYNRYYDPSELIGCSRQESLEMEAAQHPWLAWQLRQARFRAPSDLKELARMKSSYYGLMNEVDDGIGALLKTVQDIGQWDRTLIIFTSDHGEQMGDHWLMSKCGYFDATYHVPLIIRDPSPLSDSTRGTAVSDFTENVDIMPTMLNWLDVPAPSQCDGTSLLPWMRKSVPPPNPRDAVHWEYDFRNILDPGLEHHLNITQHQCTLGVIRDKRYKYVHFTALPPLFFDLEKDPGEFNNVVDDPDYRQLVLHYAQKMLSWRMNHEERALTETCLSGKGPVTRVTPVVSASQ